MPCPYSEPDCTPATPCDTCHDDAYNYSNDPPDDDGLGAFREGGAEDYYVWRERQRRYARADRPEGY